MRSKHYCRILLGLMAILMLLVCAPQNVFAEGEGGGQGGQGQGGSGQGGAGNSSPDANPGTAGTIRRDYFKRYKWAKEFYNADHVDQDGKSQEGGSVNVPGPIYKWPEKHEGSATVQVPTQRDTAIGKHLVKTFGFPVSDTQFQIIQRLDDNMMLEEAFDPERRVWMESAMGAIKATSTANSVANLGRNQAAGAISFSQSFLRNFTVEAHSVWQRIRNELFVPMAVLLLLPGAVLSQVRAIVAQGMPVLGEVNPFEGILRSIIAIVMIPATYLVVNYGIDVSNAIAYEINTGYARIASGSGGSGDMYKDAICAEKRAFPIRNPKQKPNKNAIPAEEEGNSQSTQGGAAGQDVFAAAEDMSFDVGAGDQCGQGGEGGQGGQGQGGESDNKADELAPVLKSTQRLLVNSANAGLTATWNVLCAFQMAYLYYLWCMGPIVAALWVWPLQQLRGALASWTEGVVTLCFWSLFWNTTILLMACFKGVGDTGTIIMTALNFLSINCVKYAFDFSGLIKAAGEQAGKQATKGAGGGGGGGGGKGGGGDSGQTTGKQGGAQPAQPGGAPGPGSAAEPAPSGTRGGSAANLAEAMSQASGGHGGGPGRSGLGVGDTVPGHSGDGGRSAGPPHEPGGGPGPGPGPGGTHGAPDTSVSAHEGGSMPPMSNAAHSLGGGTPGSGGLDSSAGSVGSHSSPGGSTFGTGADSHAGVDAGAPHAESQPSISTVGTGGPASAGDLAAPPGATSWTAPDAQGGPPGSSMALGMQSAGPLGPVAGTMDGTSVVPSSLGSSTGLPAAEGSLYTPSGSPVGSAPPGSSGDQLPLGSQPAGSQPAGGFTVDAGGGAPPPGTSSGGPAATQSALSGSPLPEGLAVYYADVSSPPPSSPADPGSSYSGSTQYYREAEAQPAIEQYSSMPSTPVPDAPPAVAPPPQQYARTDQSSSAGGADDAAGGPKTLYAALGKAGAPRADAASTPSEPAKKGPMMDYFRTSTGGKRKFSRETKEWKAGSFDALKRMSDESK